jgi:hypothetical protein
MESSFAARETLDDNFAVFINQYAHELDIKIWAQT